MIIVYCCQRAWTLRMLRRKSRQGQGRVKRKRIKTRTYHPYLSMKYSMMPMVSNYEFDESHRITHTIPSWLFWILCYLMLRYSWSLFGYVIVEWEQIGNDGLISDIWVICCVSDDDTNVSMKLILESFLQNLPNCVNRELIDRVRSSRHSPPCHETLPSVRKKL